MGSGAGGPCRCRPPGRAACGSGTGTGNRSRSFRCSRWYTCSGSGAVGPARPAGRSAVGRSCPQSARSRPGCRRGTLRRNTARRGGRAAWTAAPGPRPRGLGNISVRCLASGRDEQLVGCLGAGDRGALEELFRRYRLPAFRVAYRLLGNEADALDAVQDGFVKALTHLQSFQGRSSFKTWLLRVVSNASLDLGRQRGRRDVLRLDLAEQNENPDKSPTTADATAQGLERTDLRAGIDKALARLSEAHRQTFVLHADAELSYREVADPLRISIGTA